MCNTYCLPNQALPSLCVHMQIYYASGIGVSLCVGTIQGKMFRIFYIFRNPSPVKKVVGYILCAVTVKSIHFNTALLSFTAEN